MVKRFFFVVVVNCYSAKWPSSCSMSNPDLYQLSNESGTGVQVCHSADDFAVTWLNNNENDITNKLVPPRTLSTFFS